MVSADSSLLPTGYVVLCKDRSSPSNNSHHNKNDE